MRLYGIVAIADGQAQQVIDAIPAMTLVKRHQDGPHPHLLVERNGNELDVIVMGLAQGVALAQQSNAPSGLWDLYVLVADSRDVPEAHHRWLARAWRALIRRQQADPGWVLGPWSPTYVLETWPVLGEEHLRGPVLDDQGAEIGREWRFPLLAGDTHEGVVPWDYRPAQVEIDEDTDWDPPVVPD